MRIKLVANPVSGGDARPRIQNAVDALRKRGAEVDLFLTSAAGDARVAAKQALVQGYDRIIAAGGDGTLNEVVNGVASTALPIAFLPLGTVNVFALEMRIPLDVARACAIAVEGTPRAINLGRINDDYFLLMASSGWDAEAVAALRVGVKRRIGRLAYAVSAVEALAVRKPGRLEVVLPDGRRLGGYGLVVSNCHYYGGRYVVSPTASPFKEGLELCLLRRGSRLAHLQFALALLMKRPLREPLVTFLTVDTIDVAGSGNAVQVDGDDWGQLPVRIEAVPYQVAMVLPDQAQTDGDIS